MTRSTRTSARYLAHSEAADLSVGVHEDPAVGIDVTRGGSGATRLADVTPLPADPVLSSLLPNQTNQKRYDVNSPNTLPYTLTHPGLHLALPHGGRHVAAPSRPASAARARVADVHTDDAEPASRRD